MPSADRTTLRELRRTRTQRRLGDVEWFDVAYRAYLIGLIGIIAVVVASDAVGSLLGDDVTVEQWSTRGPALLGIPVMLAFALGLRSGAEGGPVAIEVADVRHVLLAPVDRRMALARPIGQRLRSTMFALAVVGAALAQLVARELDEPRGGWAAAGALYGALVGAVFVSSAVIAHALRVARWLAAVLGTAGALWQAAAARSAWTGSGAAPARGPADLAGEVALWGAEASPIDALAPAVVALAVVVAFALGGRLRVEPLVRRGDLVSQLRFAATAQDLRTVVLLRRQLRAETPRSDPWFGRRVDRRTPSPPRARPTRAQEPLRLVTVWRRGLSSVRRLPAPRLGRIVALAAVAGAAGSLTVSSSPLFAVGLLGPLFLLGLEVIEPLSQEIDRPSMTERLPVDRGWLFARHLLAPAVLLAVAAPFGVAGAALADPGHLAAAAALALPVAAAGATGPVVAAVRDAPTPIGARRAGLLAGSGESVLVPPEFAGFSTTMKALVPVVLAAAGTVPVLAMRAAPEPATVARSVVGVVLYVALVVVWIERRDAWSDRIGAFVAEGRAAR